MKKIKNYILKSVSYFYILIFGRSSMQKLNNYILVMTLHAKGYDNYINSKVSGEYNFIQILSNFNPTLCIDIGANNGSYTKMLLELTNSKVISFEPLPEAFNNLVELKNSYASRFQPYNLGIADKKGNLKLYFGDSDSQHASFSSDIRRIDYVGEKNNNFLNVDVISIDEFVLKNGINEIDFIKIDTEGYEYEVLLGSINTINNIIPKFIQIEMNYHQLFRNQTLLSLSKLLSNYDMYQLLPYGKKLIKVDPEKPESNFFYFSNFIFVAQSVELEKFKTR
jgi:FkbM family methyltransferase